MWLYLLKLHEVCSLGAEEEVSASRYADAVGSTHGCFCLYRRVERDSTRVCGREVALCLVRLRWHELQVIGIAVEHQEHLFAIGVFAHGSVQSLALFGND